LTLPAAALLSLVCSEGQRQPGTEQVPQIRYVKGFEQTTLQPPVRAIHSVPAAKPLTPAIPSGPPGYPEPYANSGRNSRESQPLPAGNWRVRWRVPIQSDTGANWVFQQGNRILVRAIEWLLLDPDGRIISQGVSGGGPILLDAPNDLFYRMLPTSFFAAARLSDARQRFLFQPAFGDAFTRTLFVRQGRRILIAAQERALDPDDLHRPSRSLIESLTLPATIETTGLGLLKSSLPGPELHIGSPHMLAAATGDSIVAAVPNCLVVADWSMNVRHALTGTFDPAWMSLDEAGRAYLVVRSGERQSLWLVTQEGERLYVFDLPGSVPPVSGPPIVAHDHTAYLLAGQQIVSVAPDGKLKWLKAASGRLAGAIIAAGDDLVVSEGDSIAAWDGLGQRRLLATIPGEQLISPPVLASNGDLLVAARSSVFCLSRQK